MAGVTLHYIFLIHLNGPFLLKAQSAAGKTGPETAG